jgi:hypothetical protein
MQTNYEFTTVVRQGLPDPAEMTRPKAAVTAFETR